jgi:predicted RNA binding protein YcfA (HicA-like mRNA interferase family)
MCRILRDRGWHLDHIRGSHYVYVFPGPPRRAVPVPVHGNKDLKTGTQKRIMREDGLTDDDL